MGTPHADTLLSDAWRTTLHHPAPPRHHLNVLATFWRDLAGDSGVLFPRWLNSTLCLTAPVGDTPDRGVTDTYFP